MRPKNAWYFCTENGNFGGKKQEEFLTAGYVVFEKSCPCVRQSLQFVQNQNIVKTQLVFLTINRNAEILSEGFNNRFSGYGVY